MKRKTLNILVAEDNEHDFKKITRAFHSLGKTITINITRFVRAEEVLCEIDENESLYDLLLTDYMMPGMTGLELAEVLFKRSQKLSFPIILLTGEGDEYIAVNAMKMGIFDYLSKDINNVFMELLPSTAMKAIESFSNQRALKEGDAVNKRLSMALDQSRSAIAIVDINGKIIHVNPRHQEVSGYNYDDLVGFSVFDKLLNDTEQEKIWNSAIKGQFSQKDIKLVSKDGKDFWVTLSMTPIKEDNSTISHVLIVKDTLDEQRRINQLEADIQYRIEIEEKLIQANRAKSDFLSCMSHEFKTPLNAILGFSQLLESNPSEELSPDQKYAVERILDGGKHLLSLINQLLDLSKIEKGQLNLEFNNIAVDDVMSECIMLLAPLAQEKQVLIESPPPCELYVLSDTTGLKQVLINLLTNAVKYNHVGGKVYCSVQVMSNKHLRIKVSDTGVGISKEFYPQVFTSFSRLGHENSTIEGSGVGLAITRRLVEAMNGTIDFESEEDRGSTFWFDLPIGSI